MRVKTQFRHSACTFGNTRSRRMNLHNFRFVLIVLNDQGVLFSLVPIHRRGLDH